MCSARLGRQFPDGLVTTYTQNHRLSLLSSTDSGMGISESMSVAFPSDTDLSAIEHETQKGVTE